MKEKVWVDPPYEDVPLPFDQDAEDAMIAEAMREPQARAMVGSSVDPGVDPSQLVVDGYVTVMHQGQPKPAIIQQIDPDRVLRGCAPGAVKVRIRSPYQTTTWLPIERVVRIE
jgi:hypothetical protein